MRTSPARELLAVGIFGASSRLGDRIRFLLHPNRAFTARISSRRVVQSAAILIALLLTVARAPRWIAFAQTARPAFEVASVKLNKSGAGPSRVEIKPGSLTFANRALAEYIDVAWNLPPWQVTHGPSVSLGDRYDIEARAAAQVPEAQVRLMLRTLLEDRFKLAVHRETREVSAYVLTVAPGGPRFKPSESSGSMGAFVKDGSMQYRRTSMLYLAGSLLTNMPSLGRPVVDHTGLDGAYDFALKLDNDPATLAPDGKGGMLQQLDNGLQASLKDLGLKLELRKTPIEYLVVDHLEPPDAN